MKLRNSGLLMAATLLMGALALAQTSSSGQTTSSAPAAGAGASAQTSAPQGAGAQAGVSATTPQSTTPQTTAPSSSSQTAQPENSGSQSTTTYTTTTQTTVPSTQSTAPQSGEAAGAAPQSGTATSPASSSGQPASSVAAGAGQPEVVIDPGKIYNDKQPTSWVGKPILLQNVMIQDTNDSGNFWVGSDGDHRLLVVRQENNPTLQAMRFHKGDVVTVQGTVQPASRYMAKQTSESGGDMHDAEKSTGVILLADNITVSSSTHK